MGWTKLMLLGLAVAVTVGCSHASARVTSDAGMMARAADATDDAAGAEDSDVEEVSCARVLATDPETFIDAEHECEACADHNAAVWGQCKRHQTLAKLQGRPDLMTRLARVDRLLVEMTEPVGDLLGIMIGGTGTGHMIARYEPQLETRFAEIAAMYLDGRAQETSDAIRRELELVRDSTLRRIEQPTPEDLSLRADNRGYWRELWGEAAAQYRERFVRLRHNLPEGDRGALEVYRLLAGINRRFLQPLKSGSGSTDPPAQTATERELDVYVFNKKMDMVMGKEAWVRSPTQVAMNFLGKGFSDTTSGRVLGIEVAYESGEENRQVIGHTAWVTVTSDGFADDSIRGTRYRFRLVFEEPGAWRMKQALVSWRCWQGRGQQGYAAENCY